MHFETQNAFQNALNHIFSRKKKTIEKQHVCLPYRKFLDLLPETHKYFIWPSEY